MVRRSAVWYFLLSFVVRFSYNIIVFAHLPFSAVQRAFLHFLLAILSALFAWLALRLYKRSTPPGTNAGCLFVGMLYLNIVASFIAIFFALVGFFAIGAGDPETLWLL
jgi:hypothetical protein